MLCVLFHRVGGFSMNSKGIFMQTVFAKTIDEKNIY